MATLRSLVLSAPALLAVGVVACVACSGGQSQAPPTGATALPCLVTLAMDCCGDAGTPPCKTDLTAAEHCGDWPTGADIHVYTTACDGYTAVSVRLETENFTSFYLYDATSGTLEVVGDDAQEGQPGAPDIECGAGPSNVSLQTTCMTQWLDTTQSSACVAGTSPSPSICQ